MKNPRRTLTVMSVLAASLWSIATAPSQAVEIYPGEGAFVQSQNTADHSSTPNQSASPKASYTTRLTLEIGGSAMVRNIPGRSAVVFVERGAVRRGSAVYSAGQIVDIMGQDQVAFANDGKTPSVIVLISNAIE